MMMASVVDIAPTVHSAEDIRKLEMAKRPWPGH